MVLLVVVYMCLDKEKETQKYLIKKICYQKKGVFYF